ncbi:MAG TPA: GNAT family N-acetyltransferase [Thermomicrobiales bacterium]|nr:GNAT family N-acetyltransferase [Thermomicrobiales bacterium]
MTKSAQELIIRPFQAADQDAARALILAGLADRWGTLDPTLNPDLHDLAAWYGPKRGQTIVAEQNGMIIGTGTIYAHDQETAELVRMSVAAFTRGQGIARLLVQELAERARMAGFRALICETTDTWDSAIQLYLRCGFAITERRDGDVFFRLDLAQPAQD